MSYVKNKGTDQAVHLHSLISTFVVRFLDSVIHIFAISKNSRLASFCESYLVASSEDRFSHDVTH